MESFNLSWLGLVVLFYLPKKEKKNEVAEACLLLRSVLFLLLLVFFWKPNWCNHFFNVNILVKPRQSLDSSRSSLCVCVFPPSNVLFILRGSRSDPCRWPPCPSNSDPSPSQSSSSSSSFLWGLRPSQITRWAPLSFLRILKPFPWLLCRVCSFGI